MRRVSHTNRGLVFVWFWCKVTYDVKLAKYYCWAQTARFVYVSVFIPTGYSDKQLNFQVHGWAEEPSRSLCVPLFREGVIWTGCCVQV